MAVPLVSDLELARFHAPPAPRHNPDADPAPADFRALLRRFRDRRHWSQERCAFECEMDHSLVSRLESGSRTPTRAAIGKLATGLRLTPAERDGLLVAAMFLPVDVLNVIPDPFARRLVGLWLSDLTDAQRGALVALVDLIEQGA